MVNQLNQGVETQNEQNKGKELTNREQSDRDREKKNSIKERKILIGKIKVWIPWIIFLTVIVGGIYWAFTAVQEVQADRPGEDVEIVAANHIGDGEEYDLYNSNPATSGPHAGPASWGFNESEVHEENAVHSLEHGGIWITYKDLDDESIDKLRALAQSFALSVVISPRPENDAKVILSSWGRRMEMDSVNEDVIKEYILKNRNKSPEPLAR